MNDDLNLRGADVRRLSLLFDADPPAADVWRAEEISAIFRHQLTSRLIDDLAELDPELEVRLATWTTADGQALHTFDDLFRHPSPPLALLEVVKQFAKQSGELAGHLPREVAALLYLLAISAALVRVDQHISTHDKASLRSRIEWAERLPWLGETWHELLADAAERLS